MSPDGQWTLPASERRTSPPRTASPADSPARIENASARGAAEIQPPPGNEVVAPPAAPVSAPAKTEAAGATALPDLVFIESKWLDVLDHIKKKKIALGSFLSEGWPTRIEGDMLEVTFGLSNGFHINMIEKNIMSVQKLMAEIIGAHLRIRCTKDENGVLERVRKIPAHFDKKEEFDRLVQDNRTVRHIIDTFDGEFFK
jgi:hypothetical protein